jgi:hypothetical protein
MACTGVEAVNPICQLASTIGSLGSSVTNSVFSSVASAFGNTADSAINWLWSQISSSTSVSLGGTTFELDLGIVAAIAAVLCVGLFVIQLALSALKRDGSGIGRALRGLAVATVGCAITLATLDLLLAAIDQLCASVVQLATGDSIATLGAKIIDPALFTGLVAGPGAILILSLIAILAVAIVWFAMVVRKMLIIITAIFAPLAFAGGVADVSRGWVRKWLEAMLALVFSKLILILVFVIGLGVLGGMGSSPDAKGLTAITGDITGLLILLVAGLSPWMALKLVHFTGDHMAMLAGSASHATSGASRAISAPQKMASSRWAAQSLGSSPLRADTPTRRGTPSGAKAPGSAGASGGASTSADPSQTVGASVATAGVSLAASQATHVAKGVGETVTSGVQRGSDAAPGASPPPSTAGGESAKGSSTSEPPLNPRTPPPTRLATPTRSQRALEPDDGATSGAHVPTVEPTTSTTSFPSSVPPLRFSGSESKLPKE